MVPLIILAATILAIYVAHLLFGVYVLRMTGNPADLKHAGAFGAALFAAITRALASRASINQTSARPAARGRLRHR